MLLLLLLLIPECVTKGSCFSVGVWGRDCVRSDFGNDIAHGRARSRYARCAVPLGSGGRVVSDALCGCDWRRVALCRCDWRGGRRVGSAVPLGVHSVAGLA